MQTTLTVSQDADPVEALLCCYQNRTSQIQIIRITNIPNWYFERVAFPSQQILFEAPETAHLEVHTGTSVNSILSDHISCDRLRVALKTGSEN